MSQLSQKMKIINLGNKFVRCVHFLRHYEHKLNDLQDIYLLRYPRRSLLGRDVLCMEKKFRSINNVPKHQ